MKTWLEPQQIPVPVNLLAAVGGHPMVSRVLVQRGIKSPEQAQAFLYPDDYFPTPAAELPGLPAAVDRLADAIRQKEPICVWGDFDVDGQTATTLLVQTLRDLGANVTFHIPVREYESHGVNLPFLERVIAGGARLVLTCDTGITANEAVEFAHAKGVDFIVTDHHDLPPTLPDAVAVVTPRLLRPHPLAVFGRSLPAFTAPLSQGERGVNHPLETLPGVGVAYKLAEELYLRFGRESEILKHADLAALGIVADVAIQTGDARYLVQRGLEALRKAERLGLKAMMESAEINPTWLTEAHIGFVLGPRLNALGRLSDANVSVEFLTTQDLSRARVIALQLEGLNAKRQMLTSQVFQAAQAQVQRDPALLEEPVLVLAHPSWPAGVIGIVASRLVERYNRPTVLIANPPGELARGSARSIEGCNITAAIAEQKDLLTSFGGHPMAAGLAIDPERIPEFRRGLSRSVRKMVGELRAEADLQVDGYLSLPELSLDLVEDFQRLAPFGPGNPALVLVARNLALKSHSQIGRGGEHLQLIVEDEQRNSHKVLWWQGAGWDLPQGRFDLAFTVHASDYRGQRDVQVEYVDARLLEPSIALAEPARVIEVVDYRQELQPVAVLKQLVAEKDVLVWCEADATDRLAKLCVDGYPRNALAPSKALAIWTTPPGRRELEAAIEQVSPDVVYLFGIDPEAAEMEPFLKRLAGLVKYALKVSGGEVELSGLAAAIGQREATVRKGLEWRAARGHLVISAEEGGHITLGPGNQAGKLDVSAVTTQLKALLDETAAFRAYFHKAGKDGLICPSEG